MVTLMFSANIGRELFSLSMTWHMVSVAAFRLQGLGTSFKAFIRLKSNAAITLSLQQKSIPEMLHKMHQQAQPDKGVTRLHSQMLLIHPSHAWSLRLEIIHLPGKERNKNILRHQATEMLHKHYCFCNNYHGCLSRLGFFSWDPASWVVKDRPWNTIQVLKDS